MNKLEGSFFLDLPPAELVGFVGVPVAFDFLVDTHELDGFFHLGEAGPVLEIGYASLQFLLVQFFLVDPPDLFGSEGAIDHEDVGQEQFRADLVVLAVFVFACGGLSEHWSNGFGCFCELVDSQVSNQQVHDDDYLLLFDCEHNQPSNQIAKEGPWHTAQVSPLARRMYPLSPQPVPQLFFIVQAVSEEPTMNTAWFIAFAQLLKMPLL